MEEDEAYLRSVEGIEGILAEEQQIYWQNRGSGAPAGEQPKSLAGLGAAIWCRGSTGRRKATLVAADHLVEALRSCRMTLREIGSDLRFEAPAAHGCRMVIAAIDALAHLITGRPRLFAEQDVGTRRNQLGEEIGAPTVDRLLDELGECRGAAIRALTAVKVQGVISNAIGMLTSSIDVLARMLTGEPGYYGTDRGCGAPGRRSWSNDQSKPG